MGIEKFMMRLVCRHDMMTVGKGMLTCQQKIIN